MLMCVNCNHADSEFDSENIDRIIINGVIRTKKENEEQILFLRKK